MPIHLLQRQLYRHLAIKTVYRVFQRCPLLMLASHPRQQSRAFFSRNGKQHRTPSLAANTPHPVLSAGLVADDQPSHQFSVPKTQHDALHATCIVFQAAPQGWSLTVSSSDGDNPRSWALPEDASIPANGYLLVAAGGDDACSNAAPGAPALLPSSLSLSKGGGNVMLTAADGSVANAVIYPR